MSPTIEPDPDPRRSPSEMFWAFQNLPLAAQEWEELLLHGTDYFGQLPPGIDEKKARRLGRAKWNELGAVLIEFWGPKAAHKIVGMATLGARPKEPRRCPVTAVTGRLGRMPLRGAPYGAVGDQIGDQISNRQQSLWLSTSMNGEGGIRTHGTVTRTTVFEF